MPASYCGITALKPTAGLIPVTGAYAMPGGLSDPRSQVGPMARYVSDLALVLPVLAGPDGIDSGVVPVPLPKRTPQLDGLKVAWYADDGMAKPTQAVSAAVRAAARALADQGCAVSEERLPSLTEAWQVTQGYWGLRRMSHERMYRRLGGFPRTPPRFLGRVHLTARPVAARPAPPYRV